MKEYNYTDWEMGDRVWFLEGRNKNKAGTIVFLSAANTLVKLDSTGELVSKTRHDLMARMSQGDA